MTGAAPRSPTAGATRRARLLDVARDLLGDQGSAAVTVRSVCRHAKLTDRYFYESFADREQLLLAVYDQVAAEVGTALADAVAPLPADDHPAKASAAVRAFVTVLTEDPRTGRILLLEPMTDAALSRRGTESMPMFADLVRAHLREGVDPLEARLTATALIGALANLFIRWLDGSLPASREQLTDYCVRMLLTALPAHPAPGGAGPRPTR